MPSNKPCSEKDCEKAALARGWCAMHYRRWRLYGDPRVVRERGIDWGTNSEPIEPGMRFGRLVVIELMSDRSDGKRIYRCLCDCSRETRVTGKRLKNGGTKSCGCLRRDPNNRKPRIKHGATRKGTRHALYATWTGMRGRCAAGPDTEKYSRYRGRDIYVDPRWDDFLAFVADMGEKPGPEYSLDRIDNDGPYSPENCRWSRPAIQRDNQSRSYLPNRYAWLNLSRDAMAEMEKLYPGTGEHLRAIQEIVDKSSQRDSEAIS